MAIAYMYVHVLKMAPVIGPKGTKLYLLESLDTINLIQGAKLLLVLTFI